MIQTDKCNLRGEVTSVTRLSSSKLNILFSDLAELQNEVANRDVTILKKVSLEGIWAQNQIFKQSIIHLINPIFDEDTDTYVINNSNGFAVIEPDDLLTCTLIASSLFCERKTWLNNVFSGQVGTNRAMLVGTLVHEVFQHGVKNKISDINKLIKFLDEMLDDATVMLEIYSVELHLRDIRVEAIAYLSSVKEWIEKFMLNGASYPLTNNSDLEAKIISIKDIEENVWSTKYGLKGKIDVTGLVRIHDKRLNKSTDKIIPLELKTGNPNLSSSHAAQVSLYSMMIEDRYAETNQGLVIYLKNQASMHSVPLTHNIKRDLIQRRNQINYHLKSNFLGPEMLDQTRLCTNCERLTECVMMSNLYTPGKIDQYSCMKSLEPDAIGHLDDKFMSFFQECHEKLTASMLSCNGLSNKKDGDNMRSKGSFWTYSSEEAESRGSGFGGLQVHLSTVSDASIIVFKRHLDHKNSNLSTDSQTDSQLKPVAKKQKISDFFHSVKRSSTSPQDSKVRSKPFNLENNFARCRVAISLDNNLSNMDSQNSSTAIAIGFINEIKEDAIIMKVLEGRLDSLKTDRIYRVDRLEKKSQIEIQRAVLVRLLAREDWRCDRVRQLLLDPTFKPIENTKLNLFILSSGFDEICNLDAKQQRPVVESISTDNYYIFDERVLSKKEQIHKTVSVIAKVVNNLDKSLLIVAQNIDDLVDLMKLFQQEKLRFNLIDDGKSTKARFQYAANLVKVPQNDSLELTKKYDAYIRQHERSTLVITTYAMSIGGLLFTRKTFDYCICYDCDTTELLIGLSPMFCSDKYIIIDMQDKGKEVVTEKQRQVTTSFASLGDHLRSLRKNTLTAEREEEIVKDKDK